MIDLPTCRRCRDHTGIGFLFGLWLCATCMDAVELRHWSNRRCDDCRDETGIGWLDGYWLCADCTERRAGIGAAA